MADRNGEKGNEPQSYGSQGEWLSGKTGQSVEHSQETSRRRDEDFYDRDSSSSLTTEESGGKPSSVQLQERDRPVPDTSDVEVTGTGTRKVADAPEGAASTSYFKERDYK